MINTPFDVVCDQRIGKDAELSSFIVKIIQREIAKYMKCKLVVDDNYINFAHLGESTGTVLKHALNTLDLLEPGTWIIDTRESNHMCTDLNLINHPTILTKLTPTKWTNQNCTSCWKCDVTS